MPSRFAGISNAVSSFLTRSVLAGGQPGVYIPPVIVALAGSAIGVGIAIASISNVTPPNVALNGSAVGQGIASGAISNATPTVKALSGSAVGQGIANGAISNVSANPTGTVYGSGDSIMYGYNQHTAPLLEMGYPSSVTVVQGGVPGTLASTILTNAQNGNFDQYRSTTQPSIFIVQAGVNDLCHGNNTPGATIYNSSNAPLVALMKSKGWYVAIGTLLPVSVPNSGVAYTPADETERQNYNTLVRNNTAGADYVIDFAANPTIGDAANVNSNTTYYDDGLHPTQVGYDALVSQYKAAVNALISNPVRAPSTTVMLSGSAIGQGIATGAISNTGPSLLSGSAIGQGIATGAITNGAPAVATTFNTTPLRQPNGGSYVYSNSNRTILSTGAAYPSQGTALTVASITAKKMFAAKLDADPNTYGLIGINTATLTSAASVGFDANGVAIYDSAGVWSNGSNIVSAGNSFTFAASATVGVLVDYAAGLLWFTKDGTTFYGTAATNAAGVAAGTNGINIAAVIAKGAIYGALGERDNPGHGWTLQTAWPAGWTVPTDFTLL